MKFKNMTVLAAVLLGSGCAAFQSGDVRVSRASFDAMLADKTVTPFADVTVTWKNLPYQTAIDTIGEGSVSSPPKRRAVPVPTEDLARFRERAKRVMADAGLYDAEKGTGTLKLEMSSINRWTYKELMRGFMVESPFILIIPASLKTGYRLTAAFETPAGTARVEEAAQRKTVFHLLLIPMYPFFSPDSRENSLIRHMLWKASTDIYEKMKRQAPALSPGPAAGQESAPAAPAVPAAPAPAEPAAAPQKAAEQPVQADD